MVRHNGNLSHHEELRLDYLQKNIHYLNTREEQELEYLEQKAQGLVQRSRRASRPAPSYSRTPSYEETYEPEPYYPEDDEEDELIPSYPREERRRKKRRPKKQKPVREMIDPEPKPKKPRKKVNWPKRIFKIAIWALILTLGGMIFMFVKGYNSVDNKPKAGLFKGQDSADGVNILVMGTDARPESPDEPIRTDSIMVVNINNSDKKIKMVSFMRDTLINIDGYDYKINSAYTLGQLNGNKQGAENLRQVLQENFGIEIKHYVLIDFSTFATAIDTTFPNGVKMNAQFSTIDGQKVSSVEVPDDLGFASGGTPYQTIQVGPQKMDGKTLLNYARFRSDDEGDFGRTRRQQEVMAAIMTQAKDPTKLFTGSEALGKVYALTSTTISPFFIISKGIPAAINGSKGVEQTTIPENGDWVEEYDIYGGSGLKIDFDKYREKLSSLGFR